MAIIPACIVLTACRERCHHAPGGPYCFESAVDYWGWRPKREISKAQANELAKDGYAYYVATYDADGNPTNIDKISTTNALVPHPRNNAPRAKNHNRAPKTKQHPPLFTQGAPPMLCCPTTGPSRLQHCAPDTLVPRYRATLSVQYRLRLKQASKSN